MSVTGNRGTVPVSEVVKAETKDVQGRPRRRASDKSHSFRRAADKEFANRLVDALECVHTENVALKFVLRVFHKDLPPQYQIDQLLARAERDPMVGGRVRDQLAAIRARIGEDANSEHVLQEVLRVIPLKKDVLP
jgi:hypothetical protein